MLAVSTTGHLTLIDPSTLRRGPSSLPPTSELTSPPTTSTWSPDGASLYIASSHTITRYDALGELIKTVHVHTPADSADEPIASLLAKDKGTLIFAAGSNVHILEHSASQSATSKVVQTIAPPAGAPDTGPLSALSLSNDGTLLVTASAGAVLVHNLSLGSHTVLRGLPIEDGQRISACVLHPHSRIRLFLGIGKQLVVYDVTRPAAPVRMIPMGEAATGDIVAIACSPYSKTLLAVACSGGYVGLVDLDKQQGRIRSFSYKVPVTSLVFSADGATLYVGTETGKLLVQTLRNVEPPKTIDIGEHGYRVESLAITKKAKIDTTMRSFAGGKPLTPQDVNTPRRPSMRASVAGPTPDSKSSKMDSLLSPPSKATPTVAITKARVSSLGTPKVDPPARKRLTSSTSTMNKKPPLKKTSETAATGDDSGKKEDGLLPARRTRTASLRSRMSANKQSEKDEEGTVPPPPAKSPLSRPPSSRTTLSRTKTATKTSTTAGASANADDASKLLPMPPRERTLSATTRSPGKASASRALSPHLSPRIRTISAPKSPSSLTAKSPTSTLPPRTRTISATSRTDSGLGTISAVIAPPVRTRTTSSISRTTSSGSATASTRTMSSTSSRQRTLSGASTSRTSVARTSSPAPPLPRLPENGRAQASRGGSSQSVRTPSPDLTEPSLIKEAAPFPLMDSDKPRKKGKGLLGLSTPEVQKWIDAGKGKEREDGKKVDFAAGEDEEHDEGHLEELEEEDEVDEVDVKLKAKVDDKHRKSMSMQVTPRRVSGAAWAASPLRNSVSHGSPGPQGGAQGLLHAIIRDAMIDFRQETKAEMVGLHLDLLHMGRSWRQEMRAAMDEYLGDLRELREENQRLREENERLRRGY
ncbi:WD40 repeat-like protein [Dentipellis sp. KUC8613]|nr:WD40 repeat-like protein [Dentipellis sp. KUC8613]